MSAYDVVIVGAGHAGAQAAIALRQLKFGGSIAMIGAEPDLPYERPPLSKEFLAGDKSFERMLIRPTAFWEEREIACRLGKPVVAIDPESCRVTTSDGAETSYGSLIWAAGGAPRRLSCGGAALKGVHAVRTRADVDALREELARTRRVAVVGGGYIGLEAAAVLNKLGKDVILLEALDRVLARVAGERLSRFYEREHMSRGVDVRLNVVVDCIEERDGRACAVRLASGDRLPCDMVIVGIGIVPSVEPLLAAGAEGGNGIDVDEFCRTSLDRIYAVGDCAAHESSFAGGTRIRIESVQNANDQATTAARTISGDPLPYSAIPWFWSNQYDLRLQTVGLSIGYDEAILRGNPEDRSFSLIYRKEGKVVALDCVNATKDYVQGKKLVQTGSRAEPADLENADCPLKELI